MSEREDAVTLANAILERPNADPDDDLAILSRHLLRQKERAEKAEADLKKLDEHHTLVCDDRLNIWNQRDKWKARAEKAVAELSACKESPGGCGYWREAAKTREAERDLSRLKSAAATLLLEKAEKEVYRFREEQKRDLAVVERFRGMARKYMDERDLLREVVAAADAWLAACDSGAPLLDTHGNGFRDVAREAYRAARAKLEKQNAKES